MYQGRALVVGQPALTTSIVGPLDLVLSTLEDAAKTFLEGGAACVHVEVYMTCKVCHGFARLRCRHCHGTGEGPHVESAYRWRAGSAERAFDAAVNALREVEAWDDPDAIPVFIDAD